MTNNGLQEVVDYLANTLETIPVTPLFEEEAFESHVLYKFKKEEPYTIEKEEDVWVIKGEEVEKLFNAGWIMKINGVKVTSTSELDTQLNSVNNDLTNKLKTQGSEAEIEIRLELPLTTDNTYQNSEISAGSEFNIAGLFTIVATQENNPNWNEAGTP